LIDEDLSAIFSIRETGNDTIQPWSLAMNQYLAFTHSVRQNLFGGQDSVGLGGELLRRSIPNIFGGSDFQDAGANIIGFTHPMGCGLDDHHYGVTDFGMDHGTSFDHHDIPDMDL
jgi:hypothetical protein